MFVSRLLFLFYCYPQGNVSLSCRQKITQETCPDLRIMKGLSLSRLLIIKTGSTLPPIRKKFGDFEHWFCRDLPAKPEVLVVDVTRGQSLPAITFDGGVLITGSPAMVTQRTPWSEATASWLADRVSIGRPVLGVCYGHQLLAHALGGEVNNHPQGRESGTWPVALSTATESDTLFSGLPQSFATQLTHRQSVLRLPQDAVLLASNDREPCQAFRVGEYAWGVQFHPEFTADIMRAYLKEQAAELQQEGQDVQQLMNAVCETPEATKIVQRFVQLFCLD